MNAMLCSDENPVATAATLPGLLAPMRAAHAAKTPDYAQRVDDLKRMRAAFKARLPALVDAVSADFGMRSRTCAAG